MGKLCKNKYCAGVNPVPFLGSATSTNKTLPIPLPNVVLPNYSTYTPLYFGNKRYELNDWLGNVRVVINDRKTPVNSGTTTISYKPQVVSVTDYYSFGSEIRERSYEYGSEYRYGFNGKEKDNEAYGKGNFQDYGARMYDTRLARFISPDPLIVQEKKYPWYSSYQFAGNKPIKFIDMDGLEELDAGYKSYRASLIIVNKDASQIEESVNKQYHQRGDISKLLVRHFIEEPINDFTIVFTTYSTTLAKGLAYHFTNKDIGTKTYSFSLKEGFKKTETDVKEYAKSLNSIYTGLVTENVKITKDPIINKFIEEEISVSLGVILDQINKDKNQKSELKKPTTGTSNNQNKKNSIVENHNKNKK